jgi:hypothetical protein
VAKGEVESLAVLYNNNIYVNVEEWFAMDDGACLNRSICLKLLNRCNRI